LSVAGTAGSITVIIFMALTPGFTLLLVGTTFRAAGTLRDRLFARVAASALFASLTAFLIRAHVNFLFNKKIRLHGSLKNIET
jgi:hypothetical protein